MASTGGKAPRGLTPKQRVVAAVVPILQAFSGGQYEDRRAQQSDQSVQVSDSSSLAETQASPIAPPPQSSYDVGANKAGEDEGYGEHVSTLSQFKQQRESDARKLKTGEQFVGAPVSLGAEIPSQGQGAEAPAQQAPEAPQEEPADEADAARQLAAEQAISVYRQTQAEQTEAAEQEAQLNDASQERQTAMMWRAVNGVDFAMAPTFLSAVVLVWMINVQLVNKMIFHDYKTVGNISMAEAMLFADIDLNLCCLVLPSCFSCIFPLFGLVIIIYAFANLFGYGK